MSGQGMDRRVERGMSPYRNGGIVVAIVLAAIVSWWLYGVLTGGRSLSVDSGRIMVSEVTVGTFEDFIPLRGRLMPRRTVYLDAIEGGRVERVAVEDGARVEAGDLIAEVGLAVEMGADATDIGLTIHPHPTLSEAVMEAVRAAYGQSINI